MDKKLLAKILIIGIPTYTVALTTNAMVYTMPMLAITTIIATNIFDDVKENDNWRIDSEWRVPANLDTTSPWGGYLDNPHESYTRMDSRGVVRLQAGWVWALGKTFHSGYLNIPVNAFLSYNQNGYFLGLSMGFNITKKD